MNVVHIFWGLGFGGIETMLVNIANAQVKSGAKVSIIIINDLCEESLLQLLYPEVTLHLLMRKQESKGVGFIFKLNRLLFLLQPDVIHLHRSDIGQLLLYKKFRKIACVTLHDIPIGEMKNDTFMNYIWRKINKRPIKHSNVTYINRIPLVFAISNTVQNDLLTRYKIYSTVVFNGILTSNFTQRMATNPKDIFKILRSEEHTSELQTRSDLVCRLLHLSSCACTGLSFPGSHFPSATNPKDIFKILTVSRLEHLKKGQDLLLEAVARIKGQVTIDFIGEGTSLDYLKAKANKLKIENYVHFLGKKTQKYISEHLSNYDLFVQPSRWEGFGLTVAEAMAARLPVLVSEGQGPAEVTCGDKYGWLFINGNINDLKEKIEYIISHYDTAIQKAENALKYVCNTYDVSITANKYLKEYSKIKP